MNPVMSHPGGATATSELWKGLGVVVIGRNEGVRLKSVLQRLMQVGAESVVYVDSGSADDSSQIARELDIELIEIQAPFTAARARNAGFRKLKAVLPDVSLVQFVDGDCMLDERWLRAAVPFLLASPNIGAICGFRREQNAEASIYNLVCDREWQSKDGETKYCGGDVLIRASAFEQVGGYREELVAGEDPELCIRLRRAGWILWRLPVRMTTHDARILRFSQWWVRGVRSGYVFAQGAYLYGMSSERHYVREFTRSVIWALFIPIVCIAASLLFPYGWAAWLVYGAQLARQTLRTQGTPSERFSIALLQIAARFPEFLGEAKFFVETALSKQKQLIEYK